MAQQLFVPRVLSHASWREIERIGGEPEPLATKEPMEPGRQEERNVMATIDQAVRRLDEWGNIAEVSGRRKHDPSHGRVLTAPSSHGELHMTGGCDETRNSVGAGGHRSRRAVSFTA